MNDTINMHILIQEGSLYLYLYIRPCNAFYRNVGYVKLGTSYLRNTLYVLEILPN